MKFETHADYSDDEVTLTERALLTVWAGLGSWHDDLVLVGGLVPRYICGDISESRLLPRPVTLDADFGISLGASLGQYGSIKWDLQAQGFRLTTSKEFGSRFEKAIGPVTVYIDFLVEAPPATQGTKIVDDIPASVMPGIDRALADARAVEARGLDLHGAQQALTIRVCEVGPFLALKLRAFARRQQPKDAFDILYTLTHYDRGTDAAVAAFANEAKSNNSAFAEAHRALDLFVDEESPGPAKASYFVFGAPTHGEPPNLRLRRLQVRQDLVSAAALLREAIVARTQQRPADGW